ncbi:MAG: ABC transporter substrate-binding protein [Deltaproteobacteria bacterium]|nr:ABC transporter substrate-binding protein [Deltaproteobacteria bacterium]
MRSFFARKAFSVRSVTIVVLAALSMGAAGPTGPTKHVVGYTSISFARAPVWIAGDLRIYEKNGINAETVFLRGGIVGTQALISGSASFLASSGSSAVEAILSGADLVILAGYSNLLDQILVTKREMKSAAQLKGARVALNSLAGGSLLAVRITLSALGLDPDRDVTYIALGDPASRLTALKAGIVDATVLTTPFNSIAKKAGFNVFDDIPALKNIDYPADSIIASGDFVAREPALAERMIKSIGEAVQFYRSNKTRSLAIVTKYLRGVSPEDLEDAYVRYLSGFRDKPVPSIKGIQTVLQWSKHPKAKTADPTRFVPRQSVK